MTADFVAIVVSVPVAAAILFALGWLVVTLIRTRPPRVARREPWLAESGIDWLGGGSSGWSDTFEWTSSGGAGGPAIASTDAGSGDDGNECAEMSFDGGACDLSD